MIKIKRKAAPYTIPGIYRLTPHTERTMLLEQAPAIRLHCVCQWLEEYNLMSDLDIEAAKLSIERERLALDRKRLEMEQKSQHKDTIAKIGLPLAVLLLSAVTFYGTYQQNEHRSLAESSHKEAELAIQQINLGLRQSEQSMSQDRYISEFITTHYVAYLSPDGNGKAQVSALVVATFSDPAVVHSVMRRFEAMRASLQQTPIDRLSQQQQSQLLLTTGQQAVQSGKYREAVQYLTSHLALEPTSVAGWNSKAYALLLLDDHAQALDAISRAISLRPSQKKLQQVVAINAAKILCAAGRGQDGISYINASIAALPDFAAAARNDGQLTRICRVRWPGG
jgi:tetratricopeptide (TPR) repeat protein